MKGANNSRAIAATTLAAVIVKGQSLDPALASNIEKLVDSRDRAFAQELVYGVLRWYWRMAPRLKKLLKRPLRSRDRDIEMLLLIGIYQLEFLDTPSHAALSATVDACVGLGKPWARGLINGTLRNVLRQSDSVNSANDVSSAEDSAHPQWFVDALISDWDAKAEVILKANNERPPMCLRVNLQKNSREAYLKMLEAVAIDAHPTRHTASGIRLGHAQGVDQLPGFAQGFVSVQDEAAQLAAAVLDLEPSHRILDACAAPGGKTCHILESASADVEVLAIDRVARRLERVSDSLNRLGLRARSEVADATAPEQWWDGQAFDRILIDAPCSGSGVIRRHPDIKIHRQASDIAALAEQQSRLLSALWPLLAPGGKLVYATCSILRAENDAVLEKFLRTNAEATIDPIDASWGVQTTTGRQILTGSDAMDGFFYARLRRSC